MLGHFNQTYEAENTRKRTEQPRELAEDMKAIRYFDVANRVPASRQAVQVMHECFLLPPGRYLSEKELVVIAHRVELLMPRLRHLTPTERDPKSALEIKLSHTAEQIEFRPPVVDGAIQPGPIRLILGPDPEVEQELEYELREQLAHQASTATSGSRGGFSTPASPTREPAAHPGKEAQVIFAPFSLGSSIPGESIVSQQSIGGVTAEQAHAALRAAEAQRQVQELRNAQGGEPAQHGSSITTAQQEVEQQQAQPAPALDPWPALSMQLVCSSATTNSITCVPSWRRSSSADPSLVERL